MSKLVMRFLNEANRSYITNMLLNAFTGSVLDAYAAQIIYSKILDEEGINIF